MAGLLAPLPPRTKTWWGLCAAPALRRSRRRRSRGEDEEDEGAEE